MVNIGLRSSKNTIIDIRVLVARPIYIEGSTIRHASFHGRWYHIETGDFKK